jgi:tetratricopeptide (TPR) repeat protein
MPIREFVQSRQSKFWLLAAALAIACLTLLSVAYQPGLSGPFTLDDNSNLLSNRSVQIENLDSESLRNAAFSVRSGPTYRPVAMLSFALNYYFTGNFDSARPYKLTNLAIHMVNGLLVFWLLYLLSRRAQQAHSANEFGRRKTRALLFSGIVALIWAVHPIQLTSVLYVVQRMTSLSGTFVFLALITYLIARNRLIANGTSRAGVIPLFFLVPCIGLIGVFTKENAALLPLYIIAIEITLYSGERPWVRWQRLGKKPRALITTTGVVILAGILLWVVLTLLPKYEHRPFTMDQRLFTEARVLVFYLGLILVPRTNQFGLHHDDIPMSGSLLTPWTTLPAIFILASLLVLAVRYRSRLPLFSLGIFIFFAAHLLESTIYPLDIAYEHRNYVASVGVLLAASRLALMLNRYVNTRVLVGLSTVFVLLTTSVTYLHARTWQSDASLYSFALLHHPDSGILNFEMAGFWEYNKRPARAVAMANRAVELSPDNMTFRLYLAQLRAKNNELLDRKNLSEINRQLRDETITPTASMLLRRTLDCLKKDCRSLLEPSLEWYETLSARYTRGKFAAHYRHMSGVAAYIKQDYVSAESAMRAAIEKQRGYAPAYIDLAAMYVEVGRDEQAAELYKQLLLIDPGRSDIYRQRIRILTEPHANE